MVSASHPSWALGDGAEATFVVTRTAKQVVGSGGVIGIGGASSALPGGRAGGIAKSESSSKLSGGAQGSAAGVDGDSGLGGTIVLGDSSGAVKNNNRYLSFVVELYAFRRTVESGTGAATGTTTEDEFLGRKQLLLPENNSTNIAQSQYIPLTDSADLGISWAIVDAAAITSSLVRRRCGAVAGLVSVYRAGSLFVLWNDWRFCVSNLQRGRWTREFLFCAQGVAADGSAGARSSRLLLLRSFVPAPTRRATSAFDIRLCRAPVCRHGPCNDDFSTDGCVGTIGIAKATKSAGEPERCRRGREQARANTQRRAWEGLER